MNAETCLQIISGYFCAGVILERGVVTQAAPIVKYMACWPESRVKTYCAGKGWRCDDVTPLPQTQAGGLFEEEGGEQD